MFSFACETPQGNILYYISLCVSFVARQGYFFCLNRLRIVRQRCFDPIERSALRQLDALRALTRASAATNPASFASSSMHSEHNELFICFTQHICL